MLFPHSFLLSIPACDSPMLSFPTFVESELGLSNMHNMQILQLSPTIYLPFKYGSKARKRKAGGCNWC